MIQIKDELEDKIKSNFKENMIIEIYEYLLRAKESLRQLEVEKENLKKLKEIEATAMELEGNNETQPDAMELYQNNLNDGYEDYFDDEDYDSDDSFIEKDDDFFGYEEQDAKVLARKKKIKKDMTYPEENDLEMNHYLEPSIPGRNEDRKDPLSAFMDILSDIFYSIRYLKDEASILTKTSAGVIQRGKKPQSNQFSKFS